MRIVMKLFISFIISLLFFTLSCKEEKKKGICTACCDNLGNQLCKKDFTEKMCSDYNKRKVDGYTWDFSEGVDLCPPTTPPSN